MSLKSNLDEYSVVVLAIDCMMYFIIINCLLFYSYCVESVTVHIIISILQTRRNARHHCCHCCHCCHCYLVLMWWLINIRYVCCHAVTIITTIASRVSFKNFANGGNWEETKHLGAMWKWYDTFLHVYTCLRIVNL